MGLDFNKCIGCKKGINLFVKNDDGSYGHVDLFFTAEEGAQFKCETPDIGDYLTPNGDKGTYLPKDKDFDYILMTNDFWWEDIMDLAHQIFDGDTEKVREFFDQDVGDTNLLGKSLYEMEEKLLEKADELGIDYKNEDEYPDLSINRSYEEEYKEKLNNYCV